jgi:hypothetical protein
LNVADEVTRVPYVTIFPPEKGEDRFDASGTLRRLVCFVAAALDVRYAFVAVFGGPESTPPLRRVSFWLAKDFGLRSAFALLELPAETSDAAVPFECARTLHGLWPAETELAGLTEAGCVTVPLPLDGGLLGQLGILVSGPAANFRHQERLRPMARLAKAEVERWLGSSDPLH